MSAGSGSVPRFLSRLRLRAALLAMLSAAITGVGAFGLTFAIMAVLAGPVGSIGSIAMAWVVVSAVTSFVAVWSGSLVGAFRGGRVSGLLQVVSPLLASEAHTAYELDVDRRASPLVEAHARRVSAQLDSVSLWRVLPIRRLVNWRVPAGVAAIALATLVFYSSDRAQAGAYALLHPEARDSDGARIAGLVTDARARLIYPAHYRRDPVSVSAWDRISAPRGTAVSFSVDLLVEATQVTAAFDDQEVALSKDGDRRWIGEWVVDRDSRVVFAAITTDGSVRDRKTRFVTMIADQVPSVEWLTPENETVIEPGAAVDISYRASDDVGLRELRLVVQSPGTEPRPRVFERFDATTLEQVGTTQLRPEELMGQPGDSIQVWIEAEDGDAIAGPNVGRSETVTLVIASEALRREEEIQTLEAMLTQGAHALADRLELVAANAELERAQESARVFAGALAEHSRTRLANAPNEAAQFHQLSWRIQNSAARGATDLERDEGVEVLEEAVLFLSDLVARHRLQDAAMIARELSALRREISSLLEQLRRADSAETRRAIMAAIARAEARYRELVARVAQMGERVPGEFMNRDALGAGEEAAEDPFATLRRALAENDFEAAARSLLDLEHEITELAEALGAESEMMGEQFGEQDRAMAELLDRVAGLESEQYELLRNAGEIRRRAAERAMAEARTNGLDTLADQATGLRQEALRLPGTHFDSLEREAWDRAQQRLEDTAVALSNEDMAEAREMLAAAEQDVESLARDLEVSALMFPGHRGETSEGARQTQQLLQRVRELQRGLDRAIPSLGEHLDASDRQQMVADAERQGQAVRVAQDIGEQLREGGDMVPPNFDVEIDAIRAAMERGRSALQHNEPIDASAAQEDAAHRLTELREQLEETRQSQSSSGGGGQDNAPFAATTRRRVEIPEAGAGEGPIELRRRVLDGMEDRTPRGYEEAVRAYYDGLLR